MDALLIRLYGLTGSPLADYWAGTFCLALVAVVVGEFTISIVYRVNRVHLEGLTTRLGVLKGLSEEALRREDPANYRACNKEANEVFGQVFFNRFGLSAASLWPIFFALKWMQDRFSGVSVPLPGLGYEMNYVVVFLICYVVARVAFGRIKRWLPYFRTIHGMLAADERRLAEAQKPPIS